MICSDPPTGPPPKNGKNRDTQPSKVRLVQVDFAVVDERSPIGWVFGTYMYDCKVNEKDVSETFLRSLCEYNSLTALPTNLALEQTYPCWTSMG